MAELIINETLCYCRSKYEASTIKQLKLVLCNFYTEDELLAAKQLLYDTSSKVLNDLPRLVKRNKSDNRCKLLTDDIVEYITKIDEALAWDKMPVFVAQNITRIPTVPIEDMEVFIMAQKLEQFENRLQKIEVGYHSGDSGMIRRGETQAQAQMGNAATGSSHSSAVITEVAHSDEEPGTSQAATGASDS